MVGLYIAYVIPIYLRWRMGDAFETGPWTLGSKYKWMCPIAVIEVIVVCVIAFLPTAPGGIPGQRRLRLEQRRCQLRPLIVGAVAIYAGSAWLVSAKNWFTGPIRTVDLPDATTGD